MQCTIDPAKQATTRIRHKKFKRFQMPVCRECAEAHKLMGFEEVPKGEEVYEEESNLFKPSE